MAGNTPMISKAMAARETPVFNIKERDKGNEQ
jgi:hypothetical protein